MVRHAVADVYLTDNRNLNCSHPNCFTSRQALHTMLFKAEEQPGLSWRVGTHSPTASGPSHAASDQEAAVRAGRPSIMQLEVVEGTGEGATQFLLKLWRADRLSGTLEVDHNCCIHRSEASSNLLFGIPAHAMLKQPLCRSVHLPISGQQS